ncbi:acetyl-CoA hydrolase/transferase C-terminal domain-containing protein [Phytopseudomonas dryadis]|uniref:Acetyl-CoA hydrolase n=1 Tax=Phytopseudomonas dryadis TaxID=2487520 RepID=A0A4Q9RAX4_9GAMM|nr:MULTISPECIES: acetyl-CoA hydrolase/transferase C-terminal domain-containing protein [Pseudomonas]TBU96968.1 acetyl-CoA hydrolase [Pseudomonas dryadis]TBU99705.1 acetyl-CoA hydrolase [Pseudomonas dryadis]TBV12684.1 acetyl-CoA hydrolase [Pseudomonas sp. FRB 230]
MPQLCSIEQAVERVLREIEGPIHLGLPLGLGKPNRWVNALYARIRQLPERELTIYTALCLGRPRAEQGLQRRFLEPFVDRVYGDYPELDFLADLHGDSLPANVRIEQFFLQPGSLLDSAPAQQEYTSSNYSHVARDINAKGLNVVAQLVARDASRPEHFSLSCNPDITLDLLPLLQARRDAGETILSLAQVHDGLPYMGGTAELPRETFDLQLQEVESSTLFSTPNMPVSIQDHCIGLHASSLVRDGGTLQIGIGAMGDALSAALLARQADNAAYQALLDDLQGGSRPEAVVALGGLQPFAEGLYGCSEMFVGGLLALAEAGIVRRTVYPDLQVQRLADAGALDARGQPRSVQALLDAGVPERLEADTLAWLQGAGLLDANLTLQGEHLLLPTDQQTSTDLSDPLSQAALKDYLTPAHGGVLLHGGFFLGPRAFYQRLRELSREQRDRYGMTGIAFINELHGEEELKRLQRRDARFVNTVFTVTLLGAAVADQLEDGRVLSGVGGQYNFVAQAHALPGARSILLLRSWRETAGQASSNIVWDYGHVTIPRHLRDMVVTEYGIADLRGKTDTEVIQALLGISDSRFQPALIEQAIQAGKLPPGFRLDPRYTDNTPERLQAIAAQHGALFEEYPLGSDFDDEEQALLRALSWLKSKFKLSEALELGKATLEAPAPEAFPAHLRRMQLEQPSGLREELYQRLLLAGLQATAR